MAELCSISCPIWAAASAAGIRPYRFQLTGRISSNTGVSSSKFFAGGGQHDGLHDGRVQVGLKEQLFCCSISPCGHGEAQLHRRDAAELGLPPADQIEVLDPPPSALSTRFTNLSGYSPFCKLSLGTQQVRQHLIAGLGQRDQSCTVRPIYPGMAKVKLSIRQTDMELFKMRSGFDEGRDLSAMVRVIRSPRPADRRHRPQGPSRCWYRGRSRAGSHGSRRLR